MNISNAKALVWILPCTELLPGTVPHNHSTCITVNELSTNEEAEISMKGIVFIIFLCYNW
jgi:hypothetical protein